MFFSFFTDDGTDGSEKDGRRHVGHIFVLSFNETYLLFLMFDFLCMISDDCAYGACPVQMFRRSFLPV